MKEKPSLSNQSIIDCLANNYGITVTNLTFLPLGADEHAALYKADTTPSTYFVKLQRNHHEMGTNIQTMLHDAGIQQIIAPLKNNVGQPTQSINEYELIVYPFIEGDNGFTRPLTDDQWITLGKALRQIHGYDVPFSMREKIRHENYSPQWRDAVRSIYAHIDANTINAGDDAAMKLLTVMKERRSTIERLVNRADQLAHTIKTQSPKLVLCHSDIHAGNVLIAHDGTLSIVDWDHPIIAPKERDLMFIGGGVANVWNDPHEETMFYKGYGKTEINRDILAYYRHERIVEDMAIYAHALLLESTGGANRAVMYQHFIDMFAPQGVIDKAFATDNG